MLRFVLTRIYIPTSFLTWWILIDAQQTQKMKPSKTSKINEDFKDISCSDQEIDCDLPSDLHLSIRDEFNKSDHEKDGRIYWDLVI